MKLVMKFVPVATVLALSVFSVSALASPDAAMQADDQSIDIACKADAQTASCGDKVVGKGLLRCLHAYKKANKGFKFSDGCKSSMKKRHTDKK